MTTLSSEEEAKTQRRGETCKVRVQTQACLMPTPLTATPNKLTGRAKDVE